MVEPFAAEFSLSSLPKRRQVFSDCVGMGVLRAERLLPDRRSTSPTGPISIPTIAPISASTGPTIPTSPILIDPVRTAISVCLGILHRAASLVEGPDQIGPSNLKALSATVLAATGELRLLGVLASDDDESTFSTLTVRVLTDEEHIEQKRKAEELNDYED